MMRNLRKTGIPVKLDLTLPPALLWVISKITYTKYVTQCLATINVTFLPMAFLLFSPYLIQPSIRKNLKFLGLRPEEIQVTPLEPSWKAVLIKRTSVTRQNPCLLSTLPEGDLLTILGNFPVPYRDSLCLSSVSGDFHVNVPRTKLSLHLSSNGLWATIPVRLLGAFPVISEFWKWSSLYTWEGFL